MDQQGQSGGGESTVSSRLRLAMGARGSADVAAAARIDRTTLDGILGGRRKRGPYFATLVALADALEVDLAWLLTGRGERALPAAAAA